MITIYDYKGETRYSTEINMGCKRRFMLMTEDYITLKFSTNEVITLELGDYVDLGDHLAHGTKKFVLTKLYSPKFNHKTGGYDYEVQFDAYYMAWKNRIIKYDPEHGATESSFSIVSAASTHMNIVLRNVEKIEAQEYEIHISDEVSNKSVSISYNNTNVIDALTAIAEACETEWWIEGNTIHLGEMRIASDKENVVLSIENGTLQSLERRENTNTYATRIYPFGSDKNLSNRYRKNLKFVKNAQSSNTLDTPFSSSTKGYNLLGDVTKPLKIEHFASDKIVEQQKWTTINPTWINYGKYSQTTLDYTGGYYLLNLSEVVINHGEGVVSVWVNGESVWTSSNLEAGIISSMQGLENIPIFVKSDRYASIRIEIRTSNKNEHNVSGNVLIKRQKYVFTQISYGENTINAYIYPQLNTGKNILVDKVDAWVWIPQSETTILPSNGQEYTVEGLITGKVPEKYFTASDDKELSLGITKRNLMLPINYGYYVDAKENLRKNEIVEEVVVWDDIYPESKGAVTSVELKTSKDDEGNDVSYYQITTDIKNFDNSYILENENPHIVFDINTALGGLDFEVELVKSDTYETIFKVIENTNYGGVTIPNSVQKPNVGDTFAMYGVDTSYMDSNAVAYAEQRLYERAQSYIEKIKKDSANYECKLMSHMAQDMTFQAGEEVTLQSEQYFGHEGGIRKSRTIGFEYALDIPFDSPVYIIGEATSYSRLGAIESKLNELKFAGNTYTQVVQGNGGGAKIYIIKSNDSTTGSDENVYSAKKVDETFLKKNEATDEYLSKTEDDTAEGVITFEKGLNTNSIAAVAGNTVGIKDKADFEKGTIHRDTVEFGDNGSAIVKEEDDSWTLIVDNLNVKRKATFTSLEIQDVHHIGGQQVLSAARAELVYVEETNTAYKCYFLKSDGRNTIRNTWESGDLAYCNTFDVSELNGEEVQNHFYWRTVVGFGTGADTVVSVDGSDMNLSTCYYISLSKSRAAEHSDAPLAGDHVVLLGHEGMNKSRCNAIVLAGAGEDSPYIAQYTNIVSFVLPEPETLIKPNENYFAGKVVVKGNGKYQGEIESIAEQVLGEANTEADNIFKNVRYSRYNMLRNTGFTGDYLATQVNETLMSEDLELFSDPLVHWLHNNVVIEYSTESMSGYAAVLTDGTLIQPLTGQQVIKSGNKYTVSFKAKGQRIQIAAGGYHEEITLTDTMTDYIRRFEASSDVYQFGIGGNCTVCELQLSLGEAASQWGMSVLDNQNVMGLIQSFQYLTDAIKNGKTEILGGLILSDVIMCGDTPEEGETRKITSGISGQYDEADDVAFWAGGNLSEAIQLVAKMKENPRLSDEEWKDLAKFAVTHGGDVFMRGYIHALGGIFKNCLAENLTIDGGLIRTEKTIDDNTKIAITISDELIGDGDMNAVTISRLFKEDGDLEYSEQPIVKLNCDTNGRTGFIQIVNSEGKDGLFSRTTMRGGSFEVEYADNMGFNENSSYVKVMIDNGRVKVATQNNNSVELGVNSLLFGGTDKSRILLNLPTSSDGLEAGRLYRDNGFIKIV